MPNSADVVIGDSRDIADYALLPVGDSQWPKSRVRTGAVIGAVQSGKTASMIGMAARALDTHVDVVVVLGGRQTSLWHQTTERLRKQLFGTSSLTAYTFLPGVSNRHQPTTAYSLPMKMARRLLRSGKPIVFVAMKEVHHLQALASVLKKSVYLAAHELGIDIQLLVIDDEADDASVADDCVEFSDSQRVEFQEIPRRILELWEDRRTPGRTCASNVYATYVAYTATPQANFLQNSDNLLKPQNFVAALRTPGRSGMRFPRELTYRTEGAASWYTGAAIYYEDLGDFLCEEIDAEDFGSHVGRIAENGAAEDGMEFARISSTPRDIDEKKLLVHATRTYLIGAAIRCIRSGGLGPASASRRQYSCESDVKALCSPVTSMLVHPAAATQSHFEIRDILMSWWNGDKSIPNQGVLQDFNRNLPAWKGIYARYLETTNAVTQRLGKDAPDWTVPSWAAVERVVLDEIIPGTRIVVVNSHDESDERPNFTPQRKDANTWQSPHNHSTIFISGNVMSRGLTLEGLLTTVFTRVSSNPVADTQMQMQRWFGYRGSYIDLCRVLLTSKQKALFERYADTDVALRSQVLAAMAEYPPQLPGIAVLQGDDYKATGKISGLSSVKLLPNAKTVVRHMNSVDNDEANHTLVASLFLANFDNLIKNPRGVLCTTEFDLLETANILDQLHYSAHGRSPHQERRWEQIEAILGLDRRLNPDVAPIYRAPAIDGGTIKELGSRSPYVIAAYLRTWAAAIDREVSGLLTCDDPPQRWNLIDARDRQALCPTFRFGIRFGSGFPLFDGVLGGLGHEMNMPMRPMRRHVNLEGELDSDWGSRGKGVGGQYEADDVFDGFMLQRQIRVLEDGTRAAGQPGLVLFQPIERSPGYATISLGVSIPAGGPDCFEAFNSRNAEPS